MKTVNDKPQSTYLHVLDLENNSDTKKNLFHWQFKILLSFINIPLFDSNSEDNENIKEVSGDIPG